MNKPSVNDFVLRPVGMVKSAVELSDAVRVMWVLSLKAMLQVPSMEGARTCPKTPTGPAAALAWVR